MKLELYPVRNEDDHFIDHLCLQSWNNPDQDLGYPRCEHNLELYAEIKEYENTVEDCLYVVRLNGKTIAMTGLLFTPGETEAYLIGPAIEREYMSDEMMRLIVQKLINQRGNEFTTIKSCVSHTNQILNQVLQNEQWTKSKEQLEMEWKKDQSRNNSFSETHSIHLLQSERSKEFAEVSELIGTCLGWTDNYYKRVKEYLNEKFFVAFTSNQLGRAVGAVIWTFLEGTDFGRLEYVAVDPEHRRKGIGENLVRYVIAEANKIDELESLFLSMDPKNTNAKNLYLKCGFQETVQSTIYIKE